MTFDLIFRIAGSFSTAGRARARSDAIDQQIDEDSKQFKREGTILMLGSPESGKDTLLKQMQILYKDGFTQAELNEFRPVVYANVLESAQAIVTYIKQHGLVESLDKKNRLLVDKILDYRLDAASKSDGQFSSEIATAIGGLWQDPVVAQIIEGRSGELYLIDNASYFLGEVLRIGSREYLPSVEDVLQARRKHTGIIEIRLEIGQLSLRVIDVGSQQTERKKWIHCFEGVTSIIFCTALTEYDQVLPMEESQSQLPQSLILFEAITNSRWFIQTTIILLFTKPDDFKSKLEKVPLERFFPEYTGGADVDKATKYILWRFLQANRARLSVYPHLLDPMDINSLRYVFSVVKDTILNNALRFTGIL